MLVEYDHALPSWEFCEGLLDFNGTFVAPGVASIARAPSGLATAAIRRCSRPDSKAFHSIRVHWSDAKSPTPPEHESTGLSRLWPGGEHALASSCRLSPRTLTRTTTLARSVSSRRADRRYRSSGGSRLRAGGLLLAAGADPQRRFADDVDLDPFRWICSLSASCTGCRWSSRHVRGVGCCRPCSARWCALCRRVQQHVFSRHCGAESFSRFSNHWPGRGIGGSGGYRSG